MIGYYSPIFILQMFCLYHAYAHKSDYKWFFVIFFIPLVGCLFYLYHHFYNRDQVEQVSENIKEAIFKNLKIDKLQKNLNFSNTHTNRILLADEYLKNGLYSEALDLYQQETKGSYKDDLGLKKKIIQASYKLKEYDTVIALGKDLLDQKEFTKSNEAVYLAWSYHYENKSAMADGLFQKLNIPYTNYPQRLEYAIYLEETRQAELKTELVDSMIMEFNNMDRYEKKLKKNIINEIQRLR